MSQVSLAEPVKSDAHPSILVPTGYDNGVRWQPGEVLYGLFEARCEDFENAGHGDHPAIEAGGVTLSYSALRYAVANYARVLSDRGVSDGDRVGLLLDRSIESYCAMLAVVKLGAVYVPLDIKFPADRIAFIAEDAGLASFIATAEFADHLAGLGLPVLQVNDIAVRAAAMADRPRGDGGAQGGESEPHRAGDRLAYIIYTSGSTGRPKGVAVNHSSICNFVAVAAEVYGYERQDRVYQGLTFAFDFSVEELWVPLMAGATLVASPSDVQLVGSALEAFLNQHKITALCCVPTLLATLEHDVASLRFLLVSGEACPQDLVARWQRPGRRMLNAYGPTEATVTATWTELLPDRKVTIGIPLPTYSVCLLEADRPELVGDGEAGEIAIGGIGLAVGYVNRPDLTNEVFIQDVIGLTNNPTERLYRTGDLGRIDGNGEIEYLGRIDSQVKVKGYRIELAEIEEVLLQADGVAQAVVTVWEPDGGGRELAAYYTVFDDLTAPSRDEIAALLRKRLPAYMVPAYLEPIDSVPRLPSGKADRRALPPPSLPRVTTSELAFAAPETPTQTEVATVLGRVLGLEQVSIDDHVFEHLGLDSLRAAKFVAALSDGAAGYQASIGDVYLLPTVRQLAHALDQREAKPEPQPSSAPIHRASNLAHAVCATLQMTTYVVLTAAYLWLAIAGFLWISEADGVASTAWRSGQFVAVVLAVLIVVPVAAKWCLIGRWPAQDIPLWSLAYFRFWLVRLLVQTSPFALLRGSPVLTLYLRLLGARIGDNVLYLGKTFPLCTDLISIGSDTVLRKHAYLTGYRAERGYMRCGRIAIGADVTIGTAAVVDIGTEIGDGGQLGHASALLEGQTIAPGTRAHGSPAVATTTDFRYQTGHAPSRLQRGVFGGLQIVSGVVIAAALLTMVVVLAEQAGGFSGADMPLAVTLTFAGCATVGGVSLIGFVLLLVTALAVQLSVPRALRWLLQPGRSYSLYGVRYYLSLMMASLTNVAGFHMLFGDSSYIVHYLRALGIRQPDVRQTGSNFGTSLNQDHPFACEVGPGTMVSDDLAMVNFEYAKGSFGIGAVRLGHGMFLGNRIYVHGGARVGDNCLLASKVMLPIDGAVRENIGLLGSPCFEIPRRTHGETFDPVPSDAAGHARLRGKNRHNLGTMALFLLCHWLALFAGGTAAYVTLAAFGHADAPALVAAVIVALLATAPVYVAQERLTLARRTLTPNACTIHDPYFWWVERHWKQCFTPLKYLFRGTPLRPWLHRMLGIDMGKRVFDDGAFVTEKPLTRIEDDACINAEVSIQAHSLEDGLFKSDHIVIGRFSTIGPMAYIHYGVELGEATTVTADAFVMKGTATRPGSRWSGNPAKATG